LDQDEASAGQDPSIGDHDVTSSEPADDGARAPNPRANATADPVGRRRFLRAAVIGAAGAAGGATALGAMLSGGKLPGSVPVSQVFAAVSFFDRNCSMCVTDSIGSTVVGDNPPVFSASGFQIHSDGSTTPSSFLVSFTAPNIPPGTYSMTFNWPVGFAPSGTNPFHWNVYSTPNTAMECPGALLADETETDFASPFGPFPYTVPGPSNQDLQLSVVMSYAGGPLPGPLGNTKSFEFEARLTQAGQTSGPVCDVNLTIVGTQVA
jgi:hypothetical protein